MPCEGDSPLDAWEFWFDAPPSDNVREVLKHRVAAYSIPAVIEAIEITGRKALEITDEVARLQYLSGVLRRKHLATILPERAAEERDIDIVCRCWDKAERFRFPLSRKYVREWLSFATAEDLCTLINLSVSWTALKELFNAVECGLTARDLKALWSHARNSREFRDLVAEAVERRS